MRVAYLVSEYPAPSHTFIRREVEAMRERGVEVHTFSIRRPDVKENPSDLERAAISGTFYLKHATIGQYLRAHARLLAGNPARYGAALMLALRHRVPGIHAFVWSYFYFIEAILLADELQRRKIQVLHNHFANAAAIVGLIASKYLELDWGMTIHGSADTSYPSGLLLRDKVIAADYVACVSYFGKAHVLRGLPNSVWDKVFINRCGIDLNILPPLTHEARVRPRVICVARLAEEKAHFGLLRAFASARHRGAEADLVLVGDGPFKNDIVRLTAELGLQDRVTLLGALEERQTLAEIAKSDVLVLSSLAEGLPVVLMEAMGLSLPVVAPRLAGIPELIDDGENGLLFEPANWDDLAAKLYTAVTEKDLRARFGPKARARIEEEFDIRVAINPLYEQFARRCGQKPHASAVHSSVTRPTELQRT